MASGSWGVSGSSKRYQFQSGADPFSEEEDMEGEEERPEYTCPFCNEDFDMVGLYCHIDKDHPPEANHGACPICSEEAGMDLVRHITTQHDNLIKVQRRRRFRKGSTLTFIRKELREGNLQNLGRSNSAAASASTDADPLLSSFMYNPPANDEQKSIEPRSSEKDSAEETRAESSTERKVQQPVLSDKEREERARDLEERARKSEFVQGLVLSTFLDDDGFF